MNRTSSLTLLLAILISLPVSAQRRRQSATQKAPQPTRIIRSDTTIKSTTLEVHQQYEPELKPITKPEPSPTLPPPATRTPQQYDVPQQTLYYSYRALPLRPLALGKDTASAEPANYMLLGGGNLSTILGEVGIGSLWGKTWQSAINARYITQEGNLEGQVFRSFKLNGDGSLRQSGHIFNACLAVQRNVIGQYGYDHDAMHYSFDNIRKVYSGAALTLGAQSEHPGIRGIHYSPTITASYFNGTYLRLERTIAVHAPFTKQIDSNLTAELGVHGIFTTLNTSISNRSNNILQFTPGVSYAKGKLYSHFGLYPTFGRDGASYLLPDITARLRIDGLGIFLATAGWQAKLQQNTAQQLTTANPFSLLDSVPIRQTRIDDVFAGLSIAISKHLSVWGRGSWQQYNSLPLFITHSGGDGKEFDIIYDRQVQAVAWQAGIRYAIGASFSLGAEGIWYNYYKHTYSRIWGEPGVRLRGDAAWRPASGLLITAYAEVLDDLWGQNAQLQEIKLKGVFEFGTAAEYTVIQRLNLFLRAENLLGRKNERWLGYPSFGFSIYGGARFQF